MTAPHHRKHRAGAPCGYFAWEAAGLRWLAEVPDGAAVVEVVGVAEDHLLLERLRTAPPTAAAARRFGAGLARTHAAGAEAFGSPPTGWSGHGFLGPLSQPLPLALRPHARWGDFYAADRLMPLLPLARDRGYLAARDVARVEAVARRCVTGDLDTGEPAARIHGDLWSGNLMWTPAGAVMIDPAAHGGHHEADLAMLALFGCPHLDDVRAGYHEARPLAPGWEARVALHQLHPLLLHVVLFGEAYVGQCIGVARMHA